MEKRTGVVTDARCLAHDMGRHHPETPKRLQVLMEMLASGDASSLGLAMLEGRRATAEEVKRVHTEPYFRRIMATEGRTVMLDMDTTACPKSFETAMLAAGCTLRAVEAVMAQEVTNAFALVRPPGHHAEPDRAMGFCIFNNVAIAARHAREALGVKRVAILDFDVHHGNGTQRAFWDDPSVLYVSTHQYPYYPGTGAANDVGEGPGRGFTVNIPLAAGHGDQEYDAIYGGLVTRVVEQYQPELILVSAGFDIFASDPLGGMDVTAEGFGRIAAHTRAMADRLCQGRLVMVLEGGYSLPGLRDGVFACLAAMRTNVTPRLVGDLEDLPLGDALRHLAFYRQFWRV